MASDTLLGLDALDTAAPAPRDARQTARKVWSAVWPKLRRSPSCGSSGS
jgi:hypothetical protein